MKKIFGILGLLVFVCLVTGLLNPERFLSEYNIGNLVRRSSLFAIFSIGVAFVIIIGGIDLSIGAVVGLVGCLLPYFLVHEGWSVSVAVIAVLTISLCIGLFHGLMVTKVGLRAFIVTLCGWMIYRGIARGITRDQTQGFGNTYKSFSYLASGRPFAMTWIIAAGGVCLIVWALLSYRRHRQSAQSGVWAIIGAILTLIGTAPLWWRAKPQPISIDPDQYAAMHFWQRGLIDLKAAEPQEASALLLYWLGLAALATGVVWFVIQSLRASRKNAVQLVVAIAACIGGYLICRSAVRAWPGALEAIFQTPKMLVVVQLAGGLAMAGSGIIWFAAAALRSGEDSLAAPLTLAIAGGVMTLLGFTPLPQILVPMPFLIMLVLWIAASVTLNMTIWGRYMLAVGRNEQAALYSGINTHNLVILAYVICALLAGLGGMLFVLDVNSAQPADFGIGYELYAITAAVLGGCSLRGGEGSITGVIIGAAVMQILKNSINLLDFPTQIEFAIIGTVLLVGISIDQFSKRLAGRRMAAPTGAFPVISSQ